MAFRVKDLLINIAPAPGLEPGTGAIGDCTVTMQDCTGTLLNCTGTPQAFTPWLSRFCCFFSLFRGVADPVYAVEQLAVLKAQLKVAIADIENREKLVEESLEPKTTAQIEELEAKLEEALTELRRRKAELKEK